MDMNELLSVYSTNDPNEAEILRGALHAEGIAKSTVKAKPD